MQIRRACENIVIRWSVSCTGDDNMEFATVNMYPAARLEIPHEKTTSWPLRNYGFPRDHQDNSEKDR